MNERIRQLAEQQGLTGPNFLISSQELEKFAELIVLECANYITHKATIETLLGERLKEHFGVEDN